MIQSDWTEEVNWYEAEVVRSMTIDHVASDRRMHFW